MLDTKVVRAGVELEQCKVGVLQRDDIRYGGDAFPVAAVVRLADGQADRRIGLLLG
jgi:hypothetical protein